jgi:hypothetical protein
MQIGSGDFKYNWMENWAAIPETKSGKENGRTHGVVINKAGNIIVFNQADPGILVFDEKGDLINSWGERFSGAHGMTLVSENGSEYLWLTDQYSTEVVKTELDGAAILNIKKPAIDFYNTGKYSPTWVAQFEISRGGNGDIWVTDGYGSSLVHNYDREGNYKFTLTGDEEGLRFNCPHSLFIDYRKSEPELYIADRGNKKFQVYDLDGGYKRSFGEDFLGCPCGGIVKNNLLYVSELCARLAVLDENDKLITYLGQNEETCDISTWPNHPKELIKKGKFNSPHYLDVDDKGNIFVVEWIIGGRITKLEKV